MCLFLAVLQEHVSYEKRCHVYILVLVEHADRGSPTAHLTGFYVNAPSVHVCVF